MDLRIDAERQDLIGLIGVIAGALFPETRIIWCSDLNFSLHAFRLRADYFLLEPVTEDALRQGFCSWLDKKAPLRSDRNEHNKENGL